MSYRKVHVNGVEHKYVWGKKFLKVRGLPPVEHCFVRIFHYDEDRGEVYGAYTPELVVEFIENYNKNGVIPTDYKQSYLRGSRVDWHEVLRERSFAGKSWDDV